MQCSAFRARGWTCTDLWGWATWPTQACISPQPVAPPALMMLLPTTGGRSGIIKKFPPSKLLLTTGFGGKTHAGGFGGFFFVFVINCSSTNSNGLVQNRACSNALSLQMRKPRPETCRTSASQGTQVAGGPAMLPASPGDPLCPGQGPGPRAGRGPRTAQRTQEDSGQEPHCVQRRIAQETPASFPDSRNW